MGLALAGLAAARGARVIALSSRDKADAVRAAGAVSGPVIELDLRQIHLHSISLLGSTMRTPEQFEVPVSAADAGRIEPVAARTDPLEEVRAAHEEFERREHVGKLVLQPSRAVKVIRSARLGLPFWPDAPR